MLKPVVVYESPNVKRNLVVPHVSLADADPIDSANDTRAEAFQNNISTSSAGWHSTEATVTDARSENLPRRPQTRGNERGVRRA